MHRNAAPAAAEIEGRGSVRGGAALSSVLVPQTRRASALRALYRAQRTHVEVFKARLDEAPGSLVKY